MLKILEKHLLPDKSPVLLSLPLSSQEDLDTLEICSGEWTIKDSALEGFCPVNAGGMIYTKFNHPGDVLLEFTAQNVSPCNNDINFVLKTSGYDFANGDAGPGYIGSLNGWYNGKAGFEKYPAMLPAAYTPLFSTVSGQSYLVQTGCVGGHLFLFVDSQLIIETQDEHPEDLAAFGRIGLGPYASRVRFSQLKVYDLKWETLAEQYE